MLQESREQTEGLAVRNDLRSSSLSRRPVAPRKDDLKSYDDGTATAENANPTAATRLKHGAGPKDKFLLEDE